MKKLLLVCSFAILMLSLCAAAYSQQKTAVKSVFKPEITKQYSEGKKAAFMAGAHIKLDVSCDGCHESATVADSETVENKKCVDCHGSLADMSKITPTDPNPHNSHLGQINCTSCHSGHAESRLYCSNCHDFPTTEISHGTKQMINYRTSLDKYASAKPTKTESTDIVIIGSGASGFTASVIASEAGLKVVQIERMPIPGGNSQLAAGGMNVGGSRFQKAKGIEDNPEWMYEDTMKGGKNINNPKLVRVLADEAPVSIDWLAAHGAELGSPNRGAGTKAARMHAPSDNSFVGPFLSAMFRKEVASRKNIDLRLNSRAVRLVTNKKGAVTGVIVEGKHSGIYQINAKAVILASGGFSANVDLVDQYRKGIKEVKTSNQPGSQGDGIFLATKIGADTVDMKEIQLNPTMLEGSPVIVSEIVRGAGSIFVNKEGKRFISELATRDITSDTISKQTGGSAFIIFDDTIKSKIKQLSAAFQLHKAYEGATAEELAKKIGVPGAALKETLARYNSMVDKKKDEDFARPDLPKKVEGKMLYAIEVRPAKHYTMGGVKIDEKARVIDTKGNVIPGLFAAGEVTGGVHGANRLGGNSISETITFGRISGASAVLKAQGK